jgi:hypothetical protein
MPSAVVRGATGQPGPIAYPSGITTGIFNELNFVIPDYIPGIVAKYGNTSYALVMEILGRSVVEEVNTQTNTFSHFEKGRAFGSGIVAAAVPQGASGAAVNVTLKSPESYNNGATGTQSPFLLSQTVKFRSNGLKYKVTNITRTTSAFVLELTPLGAYTVHSGTGTTVLAGEGIETFGNQLAGESSGQQGTMQRKMYRYDNTATVLRASTKSSDLAGMNKTQIDFGNGNFYEPALAVQTMNENMLMNIEDAVFEGVPYANISGATGTVGVMTDIAARGSEIDYVYGGFAIGDFQNLTNVLNNNGGPREYHFLQDLKQRQDINNLVFGIYKNGAISYASVGMSAEAAVSYGFSGFSTDTFSFFFHQYKGFTAPAVFGYTPTVGDYRANFGVAVPQGEVQDAKDNNRRPYMQWVYQQNPDISKGQRIYSWSLGYTQETKTIEASNNYEQICYVGSRTIAAEQFAILRGLVA